MVSTQFKPDNNQLKFALQSLARHIVNYHVSRYDIIALLLGAVFAYFIILQAPSLPTLPLAEVARQIRG